MIEKLRKRVVALTMIAVFIVLLILMGIVNTANYISTNNSIDQLLDLLEENGGTFAIFDGPKHDGKFGNQNEQGGQIKPPPIPGGQDDSSTPDNSKDDFKHDGLHPGMTEETPYETRFFSVTLDDETEEMLYLDTARIAAVSEVNAVELAQSAAKSGKTSSYIKRGNSIYKYRAVEGTTEGSTLYIFVAATRQLDSNRQFLLISLLVSLGGLIAIAILVNVLSPTMIRPIAESYEKQKKFITNAGHELKTPMAVIKSCNEVVEMENGSSKWTKAIGEQVDRLTELTGQLVALAKMDENEIMMEEVDFSKLLTDTLEPFSLIAHQRGIEFSSSITPEIKIKGNTSSLTELINILADNAIKYCAHDETNQGYIKFNLSKSGNKIILSEENSAENLAKGNQNQFFDRFYRGDQSHSKATGEGYGIGLSMAQSIVNAHKGTISAESPDGNRLIITAKF